MDRRNLTIAGMLALVLCAAQTGGAQEPAPRPSTVWHALGIPQAASRLRDGTLNRFGNRPNLERGLPLRRLNDPINLLSDNPAIKKAAEVKIQEDLAPQKIKAIKYLASIGCGCYPGVAEALMAALEDCTEEVRYEAAQAIAEAAGNQCVTCNTNTCCSEEMMKVLATRAYERDENGCYIEPSARVRQALLVAMRRCCPDCGIPAFEPPVVIPDQEQPPLPPGDPGAPDTPPPPPPGEASAQPKLRPVSMLKPIAPTQSTARTVRPEVTRAAAPEVTRAVAPEVTYVQPSVEAEPTSEAISEVPPIVKAKAVYGKVVSVNGDDRVVLQFPAELQPEVGTVVKVYHTYLLGSQQTVNVRITQLTRQGAIGELIGPGDVRVARGDQAMFKTFVPDPLVR